KTAIMWFSTPALSKLTCVHPAFGLPDSLYTYSPAFTVRVFEPAAPALLTAAPIVAGTMSNAISPAQNLTPRARRVWLRNGLPFSSPEAAFGLRADGLRPRRARTACWHHPRWVCPHVPGGAQVSRSGCAELDRGDARQASFHADFTDVPATFPSALSLSRC